jgi:hypothetical protein
MAASASLPKISCIEANCTEPFYKCWRGFDYCLHHYDMERHRAVLEMRGIIGAIFNLDDPDIVYMIRAAVL